MMGKRLAAAVFAILAASACSSPSDPSKNNTETFSGSVQPNAYGPVHTFAINGSGEVTVVVTSITPAGPTLGIAYGQPAGGGCGVLQQNAANSSNLGKTVIQAQAINKATYCVQAFDAVGLNLGFPPLVVGENYTLTVSHP